MIFRGFGVGALPRTVRNTEVPTVSVEPCGAALYNYKPD